jgi:hypothetical protein
MRRIKAAPQWKLFLFTHALRWGIFIHWTESELSKFFNEALPLIKRNPVERGKTPGSSGDANPGPREESEEGLRKLHCPESVTSEPEIRCVRLHQAPRRSLR